MLNTPWESWEIRTFWGDFWEIRIQTQHQKLPPQAAKISIREPKKHAETPKRATRLAKLNVKKGLCATRKPVLISEVIQPHEYIISQGV